MKQLLVALLCAALAACGGGDDDESPDKVDNRPPQCVENPKLCT